MKIQMGLRWVNQPAHWWQYSLALPGLIFAALLYYWFILPWYVVMKGVEKLQFALAKWRAQALSRGDILAAWAIQILMVLPYDFYRFAAPGYRALARLYVVLTKWRGIHLDIEVDTSGKR